MTMPVEVKGTARPGLQRVSFALATVPLLTAGLLLYFAWDTSRAFGAWPTYGSPDPKDANSLLHALSYLGILLTPPSLIAVFLLVPAARGLRMTRLDVLTIILGVVGTALFFVVFGLVSVWYLD